MSAFIHTLRPASRAFGSRAFHTPSPFLVRSSPRLLADIVTPAVTTSPSTATPLPSTSSFAERFAAEKYEKPPVTPFAQPETLSITPLPTGTQLPPIADPLLDFTAALIQKHGERTKAARTVARALEHIHVLTGGAPPLPIYREAIRLASPSVKVVTQKKRAKNLPTPRPLTERQRTRAGILAILKASDRRPEKHIWERIGRECINVLRGESDAIKKLEEVHKFAMANRANASLNFSVPKAFIQSSISPGCVLGAENQPRNWATHHSYQVAASHSNMAGAAGVATNSAALEKRRALAGKSGYRGLVQNSRVFFIAVFASLGGLLYGWLVAILELGAWFGVLCTGQLADKMGRKRTILLAVVVFVIGVIVQTAAFKPVSIFVGRFITGLGVGSLSMAVPLYNAELAPPEVRGSLVAMQQMSIVTGIMVSFWIDYGTNFIGGTDSNQSEAAWRIPLALQLVPALILGVGVIFMPYSPRWLVAQGRDEEAIKVLSATRELPEESELIQIEYLEIKAEVLFESELEQERYPQYQDGSTSSRIKLEFSKYASLITNRTYLIRVAVGSLTMFFQQWTGINAVLYYAPSIFLSLGLSGSTISLLATGVVGITMFLTTIPTVIYIDQIGRKPVLVSGAILMGVCHLIIAILSARFNDSWPSHTAAGWGACVLVWIFAGAFGYSWGPAAWVLVAEIYPISVRGPGMSIAASSNWMNNFIVGQVTPSMMEHITYGTFIFFGLFSLMGGAFIHFMVPETKGLTLEEMDLAFGDSSGTAAADRERMAEISNRIGLSRLIGESEKGYEKHNAGLDEKRSVEHSE
ncbi:unnamed protein product [Rhizoctonia solani]|uniref:Major facilitator superfamily (MFS) profile domain-containing protein n=1 Tax=Rhizoctonia solani TaxID=456999 RepID=A0A8H2XLE2_9AGAM|nr:unnamed protein product [Rhizoctonia solani]